MLQIYLSRRFLPQQTDGSIQKLLSLEKNKWTTEDKSATILTMTPQRTVKNPILRVATGAIAISFSGVWVKIANVTPASSAFYRVFFGCIFLVVFSILTREKWYGGGKKILLALLCGTLFVFDLLCWHASITLIGPGLATLLGNFQVFILAAVGILLLKERYSPRLAIAIPLAVAGLYLVIGTDWQTMSDSHRIGIQLGLATAVFYAGYLLSLKFLSKGSPAGFLPMMLVSLFSSALLALYLFSSNESFVIPDSKSLVSLVFLGFFSQFFGWYLIATSLPSLNTSFAGLILLLQPSLSFLWDVLFFHRPTSLAHWSGVALALFAIYLGITSRSTKV